MRKEVKINSIILILTILIISLLASGFVYASDQTITLKPGLNLVSLKYKPASSNINDVFAGKLKGGYGAGVADSIYKLIPGEGAYSYTLAWQVASGSAYGTLSGKFMDSNTGKISTMILDVGEGFFIENRYEEKTITIQGTEVVSDTTIALKKGHNFFSLPFEGYTAKSVLGNLSGCGNISKWNAVNKKYIIYPTNDFSILPGEGYLLECDNDLTWTAKKIAPTPIPAGELISWWKFDEAQGTIAKDSEGVNNGTIRGATFTTGASNKALLFDGRSSYVEVPHNNNLNVNNELTIEAWVKVQGNQGAYRTVIMKRDGGQGRATKGWMLYAGDNNKWQFWIGDGLGSWIKLNSNSLVELEKWTHIAVVYDKTKLMSLYINGKLANLTEKIAVLNSDRPLRIGAGITEAATPGAFFNGSIDEVKIYNKDLTADEVKQNYEKIKPPTPQPPIPTITKSEKKYGQGDAIVTDQIAWFDVGKNSKSTATQNFVQGSCDGKTGHVRAWHPRATLRMPIEDFAIDNNKFITKVEIGVKIKSAGNYPVTLKAYGGSVQKTFSGINGERILSLNITADKSSWTWQDVNALEVYVFADKEYPRKFDKDWLFFDCFWVNVSYLEEPPCVDSDGGKDYYVKGKCIDNVESTDENPLWDSCYDDNGLTEMVCKNNNCATSGGYTCPNGCRDGACIAKEVSTAEELKNAIVNCVDGDLIKLKESITINDRLLTRCSLTIDGAGHKLIAADFDYGYSNIEFYGLNKKLTLKNITLKRLPSAGAGVLVSLDETTAADISDCVFEGRAYIVGVVGIAGWPGKGRLNIRNNKFINLSRGISLWDDASENLIEWNYFDNCYNNIQIYGNTSALIKNNLFVDSRSSSILTSYLEGIVYITHNTIWHSSSKEVINPSTVSKDITYVVKNNIIASGNQNTRTGIFVLYKEDADRFDIDYNDIYGFDFPFGYPSWVGNWFILDQGSHSLNRGDTLKNGKNPQFQGDPPQRDPTTGLYLESEFYLKDDSPCKGTGEGGTDMGVQWSLKTPTIKKATKEIMGVEGTGTEAAKQESTTLIGVIAQFFKKLLGVN